MFTKFLPYLGAASFLVASAGAQSFTYDDTVPYAPNTYRQVDSWVVGQVSFNDAGLHDGDSIYSVNPVGFNRTAVTLPGGSTVEVYDLCVELFNGPTGTSSYDVSAGLGGFSTTQQDAMEILLSNALPQFIFQQATATYDEASSYAAAIQIAFWEIAEDGVPDYTLDSATLGQALSVNLGLTDTDIFTTGAVTLAESWLQNINSGAWTNQGGLNYYYADAATEQDRVWIGVGTTVIPEPSAALLGLLGFAFILRRRR